MRTYGLDPHFHAVGEKDITAACICRCPQAWIFKTFSMFVNRFKLTVQ